MSATETTRFCSTCGIASFGWGTGKDGAKTCSINVRCLDGIGTERVEVSHLDGKSW